MIKKKYQHTYVYLEFFIWTYWISWALLQTPASSDVRLLLLFTKVWLWAPWEYYTPLWGQLTLIKPHGVASECVMSLVP